jgi:nitroreductase/NAD-dependent dihydropyrimidine dehydrogenase PreA subunit
MRRSVPRHEFAGVFAGRDRTRIMELKINTVIDREKCIGCGGCVEVCPYRTISLIDDKAAITGCESINCGHCAAVCPTGAIRVTSLQKPAFHSFAVPEAWLKPGEGDTPELVRLMASLRSCRHFSEEPVARDILEDLATVGSLAPTGMNQQACSFTFLTERPKIAALARHTVEFLRSSNKLVRYAPLRKLLSLFGYQEPQLYYERYFKLMTQCILEWDRTGRDFIFYNAPCVLMIGMPKAILATPVEDAVLASHNIRLAAHTLGLGSCLIGLSVAAIKAKRSILGDLGITAAENIHSVIALGRPGKEEKYSRIIERKKVSPRFF